MKFNIADFKKYEIKDVNQLKALGGERTEYQNCIIRAIIADPDYDENQNEWQDICSALFPEPTLAP